MYISLKNPMNAKSMRNIPVMKYQIWYFVLCQPLWSLSEKISVITNYVGSKQEQLNDPQAVSLMFSNRIQKYMHPERDLRHNIASKTQRQWNPKPGWRNVPSALSLMTNTRNILLGIFFYTHLTQAFPYNSHKVYLFYILSSPKSTGSLDFVHHPGF